MSTNIRPEISKKNKYHLEKHRYYELRHFCLQYPTWKKKCLSLSGFARSTISNTPKTLNAFSNPTEKAAEEIIFYRDRMEMVERCALEAGGDISKWLFKGVTEGLGYNKLNPPCCKEYYYEAYRRFFHILNKARE